MADHLQPMNSSPANHRPLFGRLLEQVRPYWLHILGISLISLLASPLALLSPLPLKIAVDSVLGDHPLPGFLRVILPAVAINSKAAMLAVVIGLVVAVALISQARDFAVSLLSAYTGERMLRGFRARLFRHVQRLSLSYHDSRGTSDSIYRIQYDATSIQNITVDGLIPSITSAVTLLSMIYVTARINWRLALVALAASPVIFMVSRIFRRRLRKQSREVKRIESAAMGVVSQTLGGLRTVKAFGQEVRETQKFMDQSNASMRARLRLAWAEGAFGLLVALITAASMGAVLFIGISGVRSEALTLGELLLVMGYVSQLHAPLKVLAKKMTSMQGHLASAERAFGVLDEAPDVAERPNARPLARASGSMTFQDVSFRYEGPGAGASHTAAAAPAGDLVLRDISFEVAAGTCVGIAGTTGAGKTTLMNLLMRFYDPTSGRILLDGADLRDYKLADLRNQFAIVLQEPVLFSTSIGENIAYARPEASEAEIIAAARAANAHDFISRLPQGYQTPVGERGMRLSGGERQRVAIARAFLKDTPLLILDEPTSSVDMKTESVIVEAMERLMRGRTTFIIAHRPSTLQHCGIILRLEDGQVEDMISNNPLPAPDPVVANAKTIRGATELIP
jgi:ATP-binding cassette subfamily B protein